jgi:hypothetical protein
MNERIRQLVRQADFVLYEDGNFRAEPGQWINEELEKFAELIVKQCCEVADTLHLYLPTMTAKKLIVRHFGVES